MAMDKIMLQCLMHMHVVAILFQLILLANKLIVD